MYALIYVHTYNFQALRRMFEDSVEKLCMDNVRKPLDIVLPKLIALFTCPEEMVIKL